MDGIKRIILCHIFGNHDMDNTKSEYLSDKKMFKIETKCKRCGKLYVDYIEESYFG